MKLVTLIRHGKSSWDEFSISDHDRPLLEKGRKKTIKVAEYLKESKFEIDLIISSTAVRAFETAKIISFNLGFSEDNIIKSKKLYHASEDDIFDELFSLDDKIDSVVLFGHNPTFTDFSNNFLRPPIYNLPTSGVVSIKFKTDSWDKIANAGYSVNFTIFPKDL